MSRGGARGALVVAVLAFVLLGADAPTPDAPTTPDASTHVPTTPDPTSSPTSTERLTDVLTTCRVEATTTAQVVACDAAGLPPGGVAALEAALPCEITGAATMRVGVDSVGSYRHRQEVDLAGACRPAWLPTAGGVARGAAALLLLVTAALVLRARRREVAAARGGRPRAGPPPLTVHQGSRGELRTPRSAQCSANIPRAGRARRRGRHRPRRPRHR